MAGAVPDDLMELDASLDMDVDAMPDEAAAELDTRATKGLEGPGPADAAAFHSRADPAAASFVWHTRPDGAVDLPPAGAAMADADDPDEDDVDMLQVDDEEVDDDVTAVGGDILWVGPTWGTVAGDPTSNLGKLGPQLLQQLAGDDDDAKPPAATAAAGGQGGDSSGGGHTRSKEQPSIVLPSGLGSPVGGASSVPAASGGGVGAAGSGRGVGVGEPTAAAAGDPGDAAGSSGGSSRGVAAPGVQGVTGPGQLSEGDADVRGIVGQVVHEDADDLPLGFSRAGVAADSAAVGPDDAGAEGGAGGVGQVAGRAGQLGGPDGSRSSSTAAEGEDSGGSAGGDADVAGEYGPQEVDGLEPGAIQEGGFEPASYVRHRSQGQAGMDPDPRSRPDPDPAGGLRSLLATTPEAASAVAAIEGSYPAAAAGDASTGAGDAGAGAEQGVGRGVPASVEAAAEVMQRVLEDPGSSSSHPVLKDDFAMGGLAMPALTDNAVLVSDYTEEPKYAGEVQQQQPGPAELSTDAARRLHASADPTATTAAAGTMQAAAPAGPDDSSDSGDGREGVPAGSGKGQLLSVGMGIGAAAGAAAGGPRGGVAGGQAQQQGLGQDARHLDAIFSPPSVTHSG